MNKGVKIAIGALLGAGLGYGTGKYYEKKKEEKWNKREEEFKEELKKANKAGDMSNYISKEEHQKILEDLHVAHARAIKEEVKKATDDLLLAMDRNKAGR